MNDLKIVKIVTAVVMTILCGIFATIEIVNTVKMVDRVLIVGVTIVTFVLLWVVFTKNIDNIINN